MAGWKDNLLEAALDGIRFLYEEVSNGFGRRTEVHEFPDRDEPFSEDMGRLPRRYSIRAYVLGENYADIREQLIDVLEAPGDHTFTHPYRGEFQVKVDGECKMVERVTEGRIAVFDISLVESGMAFPQLNLITPLKITRIKDEILEDLAGKTKLKAKGIGAVLASIANGISKGASAIRKVNGKIGAALGKVNNITASINELESELDQLLATPDKFMASFIALGVTALNFIKDFTPDLPRVEREEEVIDYAGITINSLQELDGFETTGDAIPTPTDQSELEVTAHRAITNTVKITALVQATDVLASVAIDSADKADSIVALLAEKFDAAMSLDVDDSVVQGLVALKSVMVEHFATLAESLPRTRTYVPPSTMPALLIAAELYDDAEKVGDLIRRNNIRHPLFVPGGATLEVLSPQ